MSVVYSITLFKIMKIILPYGRSFYHDLLNNFYVGFQVLESVGFIDIKFSCYAV